MSIAIHNTQDDSVVITDEPTAPAAPAASAPSPAIAQPTLVQGAGEFERAQVTTIVTKVSGATVIDDHGQQVSLDDRIRVVGEFRVKSVMFDTAKDGSVVRIQTVTPIGDLTLVPWDPKDPNDNGIVRARPL